LPYKSLILPFVVGDSDRKKPFTSDMELTTVAILAEAQRKKLGFLSDSSEKISFVSKVYYPLWAVPWEDRCLILDGLGFSSCNVKYAKLPDLKLFTENLKRNVVVREEFRNALEEHAETFKDFAATVDLSFNALVAHRNLLDTFLEYFKEGSFLDEEAEKSQVLIPSELDEKGVLEACERVINCWRQIKADGRGLQQALNILEDAMRLHEHGILCEVEQIREKYEEEISNLKPVVEKKVKKLMLKRDGEAKKIVKAVEKKLTAATRKKEKYKRKLQSLERNEVAIRKKIEVFKRKRNEVKVALWSYELRKRQREIGNVKREIKAVSNLIERIRKKGEEKIRKLEESFQEMVDMEEAKIKETTALCDSEIEAKQKELEELRSEADSIAKQIEGLIGRKKWYASTFKEEMAIPWNQDKTVLVYVPFYLVRYEKEAEARYNLHPPMVASGYKGILKKIRKIWSFSLESRIKLLVHPRSKELHKMFNSALIRKMRKDKVFEEKVNEICRSNNLLNSDSFRKALTNGINELKEEGWINLEESLTILERYGGA